MGRLPNFACAELLQISRFCTNRRIGQGNSRSCHGQLQLRVGLRNQSMSPATDVWGGANASMRTPNH
jgi:hypothetical protein